MRRNCRSKKINDFILAKIPINKEIDRENILPKIFILFSKLLNFLR